MEKLEKYINEIPEEIRNMISGLDNDYRTAIFVALYEHGELSFSGLLNKLGISKAKLNYHLRKLMESVLVHHYYKHELGAENYSFYNITTFGQSFFENMNQLLNPRTSPERPIERSVDNSVDLIYYTDHAFNTAEIKNLYSAELSRFLESSSNNSNIQVVGAFTKCKRRLMREYVESIKSNSSADSTG